MYSSSKVLKLITKDSACKFNLTKHLLNYHDMPVRRLSSGNSIQSYQCLKFTHRNQIFHIVERVVAFHIGKADYSKQLEPPAGQNDDKTSNQNSSTEPAVQEKSILFDATRLKKVVSKVIPRKKEVTLSEHANLSKERNFLTAIRAMSEFLLSPSDLEDLRKTKRRSPFENEPPIIVFWRKDVEAKAIKVWGSLEAMEKEKRKLEQDIKDYQEHLFNLKRVLRNYQKENKSKFLPDSAETLKIKNAKDSSGKVVWTAVIINGANFVMKLGAWAYTGSHCLFAEALHSFADFTNQLILAYGIHKSNQEADVQHPYGYTTMRYVSSLISGAMIFCVGAGLSVQHGISGLLHPGEVMPLYWAFYILGGSMITEGGTLIMAIDAIRKGAKADNTTFMNYVLRGSDPSINVVLLEDMAAVIGVGVAFACMGLTSYTGSHIPDALGSCIIGALLAGVSGFIVFTNSTALVGRSIPQHNIQAINNELESDVMIRAIHDVKGIDMGSGYVRYKAEVDFDGRELTRKYLDKQDIDALLKEMKTLETVEDAEDFILKHGEIIVDSLGAEVDRIEKFLKSKHPEVRHIDLEIL